MESNIGIKSNLMLIKGTSNFADPRYGNCPTEQDVHYYPFRYLPGDLVHLVYPDKCDARVIGRFLSERQIHEVHQYLVCRLCGRTCAGTCA